MVSRASAIIIGYEGSRHDQKMTSKETYLTVKDHSVSGETFKLLYNAELHRLETYPQPKGEKLSEYYKSEDYISHTDTSRNLFERAYHWVRHIALKRKLKLINRFGDQSKSLLDFGCGTGYFLAMAKQKGWNVLGIEPNENARAVANEKTEGMVYEEDYLNQMPLQSFDVITLWHVLEHLPNLEDYITLFKNLLKPKGRLVIAVPNYKSYDAKHYKSSWAAFDVPRHLWHFSRQGMAKLFSEHELEVERTLPMTFDAYYVSLLSEKYKSGVMNPFKAFWVGFRSNQNAKHTGEYSSLIYMIKNR